MTRLRNFGVWALSVSLPLSVTFLMLFASGCASGQKKPDVTGRIDGVEHVSLQNPETVYLLARQEKKIVMVAMKGIDKAEFMLDIKPEEKMWVEFVEKGDHPGHYRSVVFHIRSLRDVLKNDLGPEEKENKK